MKRSYTLKELRSRPPRPFLSKGVPVQTEQIITLYGDSGQGKSYFTVMLACCLAAGETWFGKIDVPEPINVTYLQTEGSVDDFLERAETAKILGWEKKLEKTLTYLEVAPIDMANVKSGSMRKDILGHINETESRILFVDSLYSAFKGSVSDDDKMSDYHAALQWLRMQVEGLTIIQVHHNHRTRRDKDGDTIDEGGDTFMGSNVIKMMSDQMWQWRSITKTTGSPQFVQTKGRSRHVNIDDFYVVMEESGLIVPSKTGVATNSRAFSNWCSKQKGEFTTSDALNAGQFVGIANRTTSRYLSDLVDEGKLLKLGKGTYKWMHERSISDPRPTS